MLVKRLILDNGSLNGLMEDYNKGFAPSCVGVKMQGIKTRAEF